MIFLIPSMRRLTDQLHLASVSRPALRPTQPPIQWVPEVDSRGEVRLGRDADHSPPSRAEVKNEYELYLSSPLSPS
jgi:hypothetical protein